MSDVGTNDRLDRVLKLRADLEWSPYAEGSSPTWVIRDPISLEFFYVSHLEMELLKRLDGGRTLRQLLSHSAPHEINEVWLLHWAGRIEAAGLVLPAAGPSRGVQLWQLSGRKRKLERLQWLLSPLAIRVKLFDPDRLLKALSPLGSILFSRTLLLVVLVAAPLLAYLVTLELLHTGNWQLLQFTWQYFSAELALALLMIYLVIKSFHELGHALACRRWQAECREIGLFFLALMPCLYCDTTDSWKISNRWQRASIAAAGIYVELILSLGAAAVWLVTPAGNWVHWAAAYTMTVGAFSTIVVNANPLLRYDGYYILSDLWKVPNLADQSREVLRALKVALLTGQPVQPERWDGSVSGLALYGVGAKIYRLLLTCVILGMVWVVLDRLGLRLVGGLLVVITIATVVAAAIREMLQTMQEVTAAGPLRKGRWLVALGLMGVGLWAVFQWPWPTYVSARAVCRLADRSPIYARQTGELMAFHPPEQPVLRASPLLVLRSPSLELELLEVRGRVVALEQQVAQLNLSLVDDEDMALELGNAIEQLAKFRARQAILESEVQSLVVLADHAGRLIPGQVESPPPLSEPASTAQWRPALTDDQLGSVVERGRLVGWVARSSRLELSALVPEAEAERLQPGMQVRCRWDSEPWQVHAGTIQQIVAEPVELTPSSLQGDPSFVSLVNSQGRLAPNGRHYEVLIELSTQPLAVIHDGLASVHFCVGNQTLWERIQRFYWLNIRPRFARQNR